MGKWKSHEYNGQLYSIPELCRIFKVSRSRYYNCKKRYKLDTIKSFEQARKDIESPKLEKQIEVVISVELYREQQQIKINTETNEDYIPISHEICSSFGCSKELSLQEKLFGNKCTRHQREEIEII